MSNVFYAGQAIRELRRARNLTGGELGKLAGLSQPKISKIETGTDTNTRPQEIEKILDILEAPQTIRQQVLNDLGHAVAIAQQRRIRTDYHFNQALDAEHKSALVRMFSIYCIPSLLQTLEFRQCLLKHMELSDAETQLAMKIGIKRQDRLWDRHHRFEFVIHEAALYTAPGGHTVQATQLDRLERFIGVHGIKIGIIPLEAGFLPGAECAPFTVYDTRLLTRVVANFGTDSDDPQEIAEHLKIFTAFERRADYGDSARALVRKAMDYFS